MACPVLNANNGSCVVRRLKTWLRSKTGLSRLNHKLLSSCHLFCFRGVLVDDVFTTLQVLMSSYNITWDWNHRSVSLRICVFNTKKVCISLFLKFYFYQAVIGCVRPFLFTETPKDWNGNIRVTSFEN